MANGGKTFFIVIHRCSFVKAAINVPRVCKLRKKCPTSIDKCAMVLSKRLNSYFFIKCATYFHHPNLNWLPNCQF